VRQLLEQLRGKASVEVFLNPAKPAKKPVAPPVAAAPAAPAGTKIAANSARATAPARSGPAFHSEKETERHFPVFG
jgi:hypothetical protein